MGDSVATLPQWRTGGRARATLRLSSLRPISRQFNEDIGNSSVSTTNQRPNSGMLEKLTNKRGNTYDADELGKYKSAIQTQLEDDELKFRALKDSLDLQDNQIESLTEIFDSYDRRLGHLSDSIQPLHDTITRLTRVLDNIQRTNESFIRVMSHFDVAAEVKEFIQNSRNLKDLDLYIEKMEKAKDARTYFEDNQLRGGQDALAELTNLVESGCNKMTQNFYDCIKHNNRKCNFSGVFEGMHVNINEELAKLSMDEPTMTRLRKIAETMQSLNNSDYIEHYIEIRSRDTYSSLLSLSYEEGARLNRGDQGALKVGGSRTSMRTLGIGSGSMMQLGHSRVENTTTVALTLKPDATRRFYETGTHSFLKVIDIFSHLILREKAQAKKILPRSQVSQMTFSQSVLKCVSLFVETGRAVLAESQNRSRVGRDNFHLFDILCVLKSANFDEVVQTLDSKNSESGQLLLALIQEYVDCCKRMLVEFEAELKKNASKVPEDGTVHELTSNTMSFFNRVWVYHATADAVLIATQKPAGSVGDWFSRVTKTLQQCLQAKALVYNDKTLATIFLLNNFHYILKTCRGADFFDSLGKGFDKIFSGVVNAQIENYKTSWSRPLKYLLEEPLDSSMKFSKNVREDIKERFKGFNSEFEEASQRQMRYSVPDEELKSYLRNLNIEILIPHYKDFRVRADKIHFSKNTQKYIKYSVQSLEIMLMNFFNPNAI